MSELLKLKQVRNGHRTHAKKLLEKFSRKSTSVTLTDMQVLLASLVKKQEVLEKVDGEILGLLSDEEQIGAEIEETCTFIDTIIDATTRLQGDIAFHIEKSKVAHELPFVESKPVMVKSECQIKLPKITLKEYDGSLLTWSTFWGQFEAAVNKNTEISAIQKFTYLKSFLIGEAENSIQGLTLIEANYQTAVDTLKSRFGNKQSRIAAHMKQLRMLKSVSNINDVTSLREIYDVLELNINNLKELQVDVSTYGSLLIAIIFDCLPEELRIKITLKFGEQEWSLDETMDIFKSELQARERSLAISSNKNEFRFEATNQFSTQSFHLNTVRERSRDGNYLHTNPAKKKAGSFYNKSRGENSYRDRVICCVFCKEKHLSTRCRNITNINTRWEIVKRDRLCFVCLKKNHASRDCRLNYSCLRCKKKHNIALCQQGNELNQSINADGKETINNVAHIEIVEPNGKQSGVTSHEKLENTTNVLVDSSVTEIGARRHDEIMLQCALADVSDTKELKTTSTCVLFDGGSQRTYITDSLRNCLKLQCVRKEKLLLKRFASSEGLLRCLDVVQVCLKGNGGINVYLEALCVPHICSSLRVPARSWTKSQYTYLQDVDLARPPTGGNDVEILVGLDYYFSIVSGRTLRGPPGTPVAIESTLGWMICGRNKGGSRNNEVVTNVMLSDDVDDGLEEELDLKSELVKFWEVETLSSDENDIVYENFSDYIYFNGVRYVTCLPFKPDMNFVPDNYQIAYKRLMGLIAKLKRHPELKEEYRKIINDYEKQGIVEKVFNSGEPGKVHYLPHRPVVKSERDTTKVRIVFDGSSKERDSKSINDFLYAGPCLLSHIFDILLRFCFGRIAIIADVKQAFLNVEISEKDKDFLRFLYTDANDDSNIQIYRFTRACFGITSSPFLLNATIKHHMNSLKADEPELSVKLMRDIYVDDVTTTVNSVDEGVNFYQFAKSSMAAAGLQLQKWYSSSDVLRKRMSFFEEGKLKKGESISSCEKVIISSDEVKMKVLGVRWNENDELVFDLRGIVAEALEMSLTKRNILRVGAKFYDPLGYISPIVVTAKIYFQKVCLLEDIHWDDELPDDVIKGWTDYIQMLAQIKSISCPRYLFCKSGDQVSNIYLHGFCDSSIQAYCAVIYVQTETKDGIFTRILTSKTKVAPIKKVSIPRLELLSCLLLSELMFNVCKALRDVIIVNHKYFWSDSEVALAWIKGEGKVLKPWVQNRISKIKQMFDVDDWHYVNTKINPADVGTREASLVNFAENNLWWYGPSFLRESFMSQDNNLCDEKDVLEEVDPVVVCHVVCVPEVANGVGKIVNFERFSNLMKLLRVVAYVVRFMKIYLKKDGIGGEVSVEETEDALKRCLTWEQTFISAGKGFANMKKQLSLFLDDEGILRLRGRLGNSLLTYDSKHPVLLNRNSYFTKLVILHAHANVKHMRLEATLNELRSRYWISRGRQVVKSTIKPCVLCKFINAKCIVGPPPPDLPEFRVCYEFAFTNIGIDYAGPLYVKEIYSQDSKMFKAYVLLLTCAATRNVHLELTPSMSSPSLIRCLKRFIGRRGKFNMAISDNFKTFLSKELKQFLALEEIKWDYILAKSPWWGAFYERLIRVIKEALKKVVGKAKLTYEEMETVLIEVEMVINSRPLTYLYEDAEEALTPSHLVIGRRLMSNLMKNEVAINPAHQSCEILTGRFKYLQTLIEHYWKRFCKEYLFELREHHLYSHKGKYDEFCRLLIGDVVLIQDDSMKRNSWKKGRVVKLINGADKKARGAILRVSQDGKVTLIERPLQRIIPLEVQRECTFSGSDSLDVENDSSNSDSPNDTNIESDVNSNLTSGSTSNSQDFTTMKRRRAPPQRFEVEW